jgi:D-glycero-D-manno-heptose 1,7-bisphosphate phosphatase
MSLAPAVFLDRDGTLNEDRGYVWRWADFSWLPGTFEALGRLRAAGFKLVVVTNQAGVAKGLYRAEDVAALHDRAAQDLSSRGLGVDGFYFCPHHPDYGGQGPCACRKPAPGLLLKAAQDLGLDLARSFLVGDKISDLKAGLAAGARAILVRSGYGRASEPLAPPEVQVFDDLLAAAKSPLLAAPPKLTDIPEPTWPRRP